MAEPGELTPGDRIDAARTAARSLGLLLEAMQRGELAATQLETARLRGAIQALREVAGESPAVGSLASRPAVQSSWYARLRKPRYQPPDIVFPVVWPILYADIAVVSASTIDELHDSGDARKLRAYQAALGLNLVLNGGRSWLFFNRRALAASAAVAAALAASSADLTRRAIAVRGRARCR